MHLSSSSSTGYKNVVNHSGRFQARYREDGEDVYLGFFGTAVEAAVAYARAVGEYQPPAQPPPAVAAEEEGLHLHFSSNNATGYKGVFKQASGRFKSQRMVDGKEVRLGTFDTAVEAAVAYARAVAEEAAAPAGPAAPASGPAQAATVGMVVDS